MHFLAGSGGSSPISTGVGAYVDLSQFGDAASVAAARCPACGDPPAYDVELHLPADVSVGVKTVPIWATDAQGRRADGRATFEVVAP